MAKYSKDVSDVIEKKMHKMDDEDMPQDQKLAIAFSYAKKEGLKVPTKLADRERRRKKSKE